MIRALIFDFDGLILDTETPEYQAWQAIFREHGHDLPLEKWMAVVGSSVETARFDPITYLMDLTGRPLDREAILRDLLTRQMAIVAVQPVLPGVKQHLEAAHRLGLKLAVASSSPLRWVADHLERLGLLDYFDAIRTADHVERIKPAPDLFLAACQALDVQPAEAIAFEDSPNGVRAAKHAGLFVVAVPNPLTRHADLSLADLVLESLAAMPLDALLTLAQDGNRPRQPSPR